MGQFDTLDAYLEHVALVLDIEAESDGDERCRSRRCTRPRASNCRWSSCPAGKSKSSPRSARSTRSGEKGLEEERRLAYVGITRARESARISFAANRQIYGRWTERAALAASSTNCPPTHVDAVSETGYGMQPPGVRDMARRARSPSRLSIARLAARAGTRRASTGKPPHARRRSPPGRAQRRRRRRTTSAATASSTRSSATAACAPSKATSSPSISTRPAKSA